MRGKGEYNSTWKKQHIIRDVKISTHLINYDASRLRLGQENTVVLDKNNILLETWK